MISTGYCMEILGCDPTQFPSEAARGEVVGDREKGAQRVEEKGTRLGKREVAAQQASVIIFQSGGLAAFFLPL